MEVVLLVVHLLIALALIGIVLLQPSEGGALGVGQGPGGLSGMMQGRSQASSLTRATVWLGIAFFSTSIALTLLAKATKPVSPLVVPEAPAGAPAPVGGPSSIPIPEGGLLAPAPTSGTPAATSGAPATAASPAPVAPITGAPATSAPASQAPAAPPAAPAPSSPPPSQPATATP